jgi:hypothetical protein
MTKKRYIYTNHFWERFRERFALDIDWDNKYEEVNKILEDSQEDKSYLNNTSFMFYLQDLYGYDSRYEFRSNAAYNVLFVIIIDKGRKVIKTCYPLTTSRFIFRKQFKKKDEKKNYTPRSKKKRKPLKELEALRDHMERE